VICVILAFVLGSDRVFRLLALLLQQLKLSKPRPILETS
jgi:hypothetical protein